MYISKSCGLCSVLLFSPLHYHCAIPSPVLSFILPSLLLLQSQDVLSHYAVFSALSFHTVVPPSFSAYSFTSVASFSLPGMLFLLRTLIVVSKIPPEVEWPQEKETWS